MSNQTAAAVSAIACAVDWDRVNLQAIIMASNQGRLGKPLTEWLKTGGWNNGKFVAREKFVIDKSQNAQVKISCLGDNFKMWHLGAVEQMPSAVLVHATLTTDTLDIDIIANIGGVRRSFCSLGDVYSKMEKQPLGPDSPAGDLLTNSWANIFYVPQAVTRLDSDRFSYRDLKGVEVTEEVDPQYLFEIGGQYYVLRVVGVRWDDDGWDVGARPVESPRKWDVGVQVFSRSSILESSKPSAPTSPSAIMA